MKINSSAFSEEETIPKKYTCEGEDVNPPLEFKGTPKDTKSLALIVDDPDAPGKTFVHWLVWNIDPEIKKIEENSVPEGAIQGKTGFGKTEYGGPCPPSGEHRYFFKFYALDKELDLPSGAEKEDLKESMEDHILEEAQLVGVYTR